MRTPSEALRLFVAIELSPHVRGALVVLMSRLRQEVTGPFQWVAPESLHLTLKFLGNVDGDRVNLLTGALRNAVRPARPFRLVLEGAGTFPARSPRVVWVGIGGNEEQLRSLQARVEQALVAVGEAPQDSPFWPHVTLARVRNRLPERTAAALRERLEAVRFGDGDGFDVRSVSLIHSTPTPDGSVYRTLSEVGLVG